MEFKNEREIETKTKFKKLEKNKKEMGQSHHRGLSLGKYTLVWLHDNELNLEAFLRRYFISYA
jgi:hypothetical protein